MLTTVAGAGHLLLLTAAVVTTGSMLYPAPCTCDGPANALSIECQNLPEKDPDKLLGDIERGLAMIDIERQINVTSLTIKYTTLRQIPPTVCRLTSLTTLYLDNNRLTSLPDNCINKLKALTTFSVTNNDVNYLQDGLFDGLSQLNAINIDDNRISLIGLRVFSNVSDLRALRVISLNNNNLTSVEPWPIIRGLQGRTWDPVYIHMGNNFISKFTNEINFRFDCSMRTTVEVDMSHNRIQHIADVIHGWNLYPMQRLFCILRTVNGVQSFRLNMMSEYFECDCVDFPFISFEHGTLISTWISRSTCHHPYLGNVAISKLTLDQFVCNVTDQCPYSCRCIYQPSNATMHVVCSQAGLTSLPDHLPPLPTSYVRYKLVITGNQQLKRLDYRDYFVNTTIIDLRDNGIEDIDEDGWRGVADVDQVLLDGNKLMSLSHVAVTRKTCSFKWISLGRNPWRCSCGDRWMRGWLNSIKDKLITPDNISCESPPRLRGRNILQISDDETFCIDPVTKAVIIIISAFCGVVVLIICIAMVICRLRMKLHSRWKFHPFDRDECQGEDMLYDVFMCCNHNVDHEELGRTVLELLESKGYRVCYRLRDFPCGELIETSIAKATQTSKRTICLMTKAFLDSVDCMREFNVALRQNVTLKRSRRLIVLMMLDNPYDLLSKGEADEDRAVLRQYLRQYWYIDYKAKDWMQTLMYALPVHGMNELEDVPMLT